MLMKLVIAALGLCLALGAATAYSASPSNGDEGPRTVIGGDDARAIAAATDYLQAQVAAHKATFDLTGCVVTEYSEADDYVVEFDPNTPAIERGNEITVDLDGGYIYYINKKTFHVDKIGLTG